MMRVIPHGGAAVTDNFHSLNADCCPKVQGLPAEHI